MTQDNSSDATPNTESGGGDLFNTAAGWVLFAGVVGLGLSILADKYFHGYNPERPEQMGYVVEGVEEEGGGAAEMSMAEAVNMMSADELIAKGEKVFAKCQSCHTINQGGANGIGPNLWGVMGQPIGKHAAGFGYSAAMSSFGGTWGWDEMNQWLKSPKGYINGTSMSFAGLSSIEDRAAVTMYINAQGSNLPVPEFTAKAAEGEGEAAETTVEGEAEAEQNAAEETSEETAAAEAAE